MLLLILRSLLLLSLAKALVPPSLSLRRTPLLLQATLPDTSTDNESSRVEAEPCNVVFTHTNADFDSLAAAVALALLWNNEDPTIPTHVVLPRGVNPVVQRFLAFHKQLLPLRGFKTIRGEDVQSIGVVDAQMASRIGRGQAWLDTAHSISVFDHHDGDDDSDSSTEEDTLLNRATQVVIDKVGSTTTLLVERLRDANIVPAPHEATLFVLGIRADTGGLVYEGTTVRDAAALLWCLENGASQTAISEFGVNKVTEEQRQVLNSALAMVETTTVNGVTISSVFLRPSDQYVAGLAQVCEEVRELTDSDVLIMGATHRSGSGRKLKSKDKSTRTEWISLIGRASSRSTGVDLNAITRQFQGGGHPKAAAATVRCQTDDNSQAESLEQSIALANQGKLPAEQVLKTVMTMVSDQIPPQLTASNCMDTTVTTISMDTTVEQARQIFDDQQLRSAPVVDNDNIYKSSLKLNDLVKASRAGRSAQKIKSMLKPNVQTVLPDTTIADLEHLLIHKGVGRIPVVEEDGTFLGMVTRTNVLKKHNLYDEE